MEELKKAARYLAYLVSRRDYFKKELETKLRTKYKLNSSEIAQLLSFYIENDLINDERYLKNYLRFYTESNPRGFYGYLKKLMTKGVDKEMLERAYAEMSIDDLELAKRAIERFSERSGEDLDKKKARFKRYLESRGFSYEVIMHLINKQFESL